MQRITTNIGASVSGFEETGYSYENYVVVKLGSSFGVGSRPLELWLSTNNHSSYSISIYLSGLS